MGIREKLRSSDKETRRVRQKFEEVKGLSITSLLDVLTIILVFLIKNVSMEAQKIAVPDNMQFPTTMQTDVLTEQQSTTIVKMYPDRVLIGTENTYFGTLQDLVEDQGKRSKILEYLQLLAQQIMEHPDKNEPCLLVQADASIPVQYVTTMVQLGTSSYYKYIYFSTLKDTDWLKKQTGEK
ncbi:MAG: biopolymer transporter ExbD [Candidatus Cloacimonadaceae bacterium]|nr:biopolymer transporter ExbD [Candidatus Cloacimonadaceae bacterium]MDP3113685.1 biopolymer transporter ExbD [Candidatus Cloacimonadaceae bacterium]